MIACKYCKTTRHPKVFAHCYGYREEWSAQAMCVSCGRQSKGAYGFGSKDKARTEAMRRLSGGVLDKISGASR